VLELLLDSSACALGEDAAAPVAPAAWSCEAGGLGVVPVALLGVVPVALVPLLLDGLAAPVVPTPD
jgi:hypothetical protein